MYNHRSLKQAKRFDRIFFFQGFFQALCHNTDLLFQTEFLKGQRPEKTSRGSRAEP